MELAKSAAFAALFAFFIKNMEKTTHLVDFSSSSDIIIPA